MLGPGVPGMNRLPRCVVWGHGGRAPTPPCLCPGPEVGPCSEGTRPSVAVSPDSSDCHSVLSRGNWKCPPRWEPLWAAGAHSS